MGDSRESPQKRTVPSPDYEYEKTNTSLKRPRTREDFMEFCCTILEYSQYEPFHQEELRQENNMSPVDLDSGGSLSENYMSLSENYLSESSSSASSASDTEQSPTSTVNKPTGQAGEDANLVTCFCLKPYANRPMIECSECLQWIHFSCAKIRKSNIPDTFVCQPCRDAKYTVRKSDRRRKSSKRLTI